MPLQYKIFTDEKLVYIRGTGHVSVAELLQNLEDVSKNPKYKTPMKKLVDHSKVRLLRLTNKEIELLTARKIQLSEIFTGERCAVVVTKDYDFGMARVHEAKVSHTGIDTHVFRNIQDALEWLEVDLNEENLHV